MRLLSLEVKGFKSFADSNVINFSEDVIGIVGPNGCGKSNIVDSIRWVLGEQKGKELRLEKMTNVIFNGSKKRKQGGVAEVSITFENTKNILPTEYNTVKITRILYRSGESEYRLNGVSCRLKDINNLLMDTGIGSNSYAIIALGMVDDLLSDRENSRRRLFEQAAGVSKYKKRKRETLLKLKNTEADLDRVEDLLYEIEKNLATLEKQAKRTRKYFELKKDYKELSIELAIFQVVEFKSSYKELKTKIQQEQDKKLELERDYNRMEAALEAERKGNLDKEKALSEQQQSLNQLIGRIRSKENEKNILAQKIKFTQINIQKLTQQTALLKSRKDQFERESVSYKDQLEKETVLEKELEVSLEEAKQQLENVRNSHGSVKSELDDYLKQQQRLDRDIFEIEKQRAINNSQRENLRIELTRKDKEMQIRMADISGLRKSLNDLEANKSSSELRLKELEDFETKRQEELEATEKKVETFRQDLQKVNRRLDAKQNEYNLTKSLVENLEGFPESIRFLSKNKDWKTNAPLLSDLIYCKEEYRVAIENYLEPYLNYYVVKDRQEAADAIQLLSLSNKGKANFFLLDQLPEIAGGLFRPTLSNAIHAMEVLEIDPKYQNLSHYLLGNVFIVKDVNNYVDEAALQDEILLSADGRVTRKKYSLSGGSVGLFEGKRIGRKKNLEILEKEIKRLGKDKEKQTQVFENLIKKLNQLKSDHKKKELQVEKDVMNKLVRETVQLNTKAEQFESILQTAENDQKNSTKRINDLEVADKELRDGLSAQKEKSSISKARVDEMDSSYKQIADSLNAASSQFNQFNIEYIRQQNKINTLQRELSYRLKQSEENGIQIENNDLQFKQAELELEMLEEEVGEIERDLLLAYETKKEKEALLSSAEQVYFQSRGGINEIEDKIRKGNRLRQDALTLIADLNNKFNEVKLRMTSISERMKVEFSVEMKEILNKDPNPEYNQVDLNTKVVRIKSRLDNYGEINPMALEAYDEMNERYGNIREQRDDIVEAKTSLLETITEIETTATEQFVTAFDQVKVHFKKVFRSLFSENDECDIRLEDPDNPLESKILITAKPKGKRPQSINSLSGGEKTLTATALLFSLYLLKPAPFCIFDEVDAPLDDTNISKFNNIIKEFSKDSQFIIVTHNKLTMASVDIIYGVSLKEPGVSTVVPVDFRDWNMN